MPAWARTDTEPSVRPDAGLPVSQPGTGTTSAEFRASFGEGLAEVLDVAGWRPGLDLTVEYARLEREIAEAVERETAVQAQIRRVVFPKLKASAGPPEAGFYDNITRGEIAAVHRGLLFNGGVQAADGYCKPHDSLALTVYRIGVSLAAYTGDQGSWAVQLFRKDLREHHDDMVEQMLALWKPAAGGPG